MLVTKSGKIIFEPLEYSKNYIKTAKLIISDFKDKPGILHKITGVLFIHEWNILSASILTKENHIEDVFTVESLNPDKFHVNIEKLELIERELKRLLENEIHMSEYLSYFPEKTKILIDNMKPSLNTDVQFELLESNEKLKIKLFTIDRPGILYFITQIFFLSDLNILQFDALTDQGLVKDVFLVQKNNQLPFTERNLKEYESLLKKFI